MLGSVRRAFQGALDFLDLFTSKQHRQVPNHEKKTHAYTKRCAEDQSRGDGHKQPRDNIHRRIIHKHYTMDEQMQHTQLRSQTQEHIKFNH